MTLRRTLTKTLALALSAILAMTVATIGSGSGAALASAATPDRFAKPPPVVPPAAATPCVYRSASNPVEGSVSGNRILSTTGQRMVPDGMSIFGLAISFAWAKNVAADEAQMKAAATVFCTNYIRIQVSPVILLDQSPYNTAYLSDIETEVNYALGLGQDVILTPQYQHSPDAADNLGPTASTVAFWNLMGPLYNGNTRIWFDIFNEPHNTINSGPGTQQWRDGTAKYVGMQALFNDVRAITSNFLIVEGPNGGKSLTYIPTYPIVGSNFAYGVHPYREFTSSTWATNFGTVSASVPVIADEWSQYARPINGCTTTAPTEVPALLGYLQAHGIGLGGWALIPGVLVTDVTSFTPTIIDQNYTCKTGTSEGAGSLIQQDFVANSGMVDASSSVTASSTPSGYGSSATLVVNVAGAAGTGRPSPSGTVTVTDASGQIEGSATVAIGAPTYVILPAELAGGSHPLTVSYSGDGAYPPSSTSATQVVSPATVTISASGDEGSYGQPALVHVGVVGPGAVPGGTVTVTGPGGRPTGTAQLDSSGNATVVLAGGELAPGNDALDVSYSGDANHGAAATSTDEIVDAASTSLSVETTSSVYGAGGALSVTIDPSQGGSSGAAPTGVLSVTDGNGDSVGNAVVSADTTLVTLDADLPAGSDTLTVTYSGDVDYLGATSTTVESPTAAPTVASAPATTSIYGVAGALNVEVDPVTQGGAAPTGSLVVTDAYGNVVGGAALAGSSTALSLDPSLAPGANPLTVTYSGDANYLATTVATFDAVSASPTVVTSNETDSTYGSAAVMTVTLAGVGVGGLPPSGTLVVTDGAGDVVGSATATAPTTTIALDPALSAGSDPLTVTYSGDGNYLGAVGSFTQLVSPASSTVTASSTQSSYGQPGSVLVSVTSVTPPGALPLGGTILVTDASGVSRGSANEVAGTAVAVGLDPALPVGSDVLTVTWSGDVDHATASTTVTDDVVALQPTVAVNAAHASVSLGVPLAVTTVVTATSGIIPTGTVDLQATDQNANVVDLGTAALVAGQVTQTITLPTKGNWTLIGYYTPDAASPELSAYDSSMSLLSVTVRG